MLRELIIECYLLIVKVAFLLFKLFPLQEKTTFISTFDDNINYTLSALEKYGPEQAIVILHRKNNTSLNSIDYKLYRFSLVNFQNFFMSIYHLATSKYIFVDNYIGEFAVMNFNQEVKCVQLWHAAGAIKQFGLKDKTNLNRSTRAIKRFKSVYSKFNFIVVGSDKMIDVFNCAFGKPDAKYIKVGMPRIDYFYNFSKMFKSEQALNNRFPQIKNKKTILYAPTYRESELSNPSVNLDFKKLYSELANEGYILLLKLHPTISSNFKTPYPDFIINVSDMKEINELLIISDILITDYSSIPMEYALLNRPMIFYPYDLKEYISIRGIWNINYEKSMPGPVVYTTDEIINVIKNNDFKIEKVNQFKQDWNKYANGHSSEYLIKTIYN